MAWRPGSKAVRGRHSFDHDACHSREGRHRGCAPGEQRPSGGPVRSGGKAQRALVYAGVEDQGAEDRQAALQVGVATAGGPMDAVMLLSTSAAWSLLIVRVFLGVIFFAHGAQKVFGWFGGPGLKGTIGYFQSALHVPPALAVLAALTECFGGLAVFLGLLTRFAALGLFVVMLVAVAKVHWRNGFFLNMSLQPGKGHGFEFNWALIGMALALLVGGGGAKSLDRLILRWLM